jgi:hypothetical protein
LSGSRIAIGGAAHVALGRLLPALERHEQVHRPLPHTPPQNSGMSMCSRHSVTFCQCAIRAMRAEL